MRKTILLILLTIFLTSTLFAQQKAETNSFRHLSTLVTENSTSEEIDKTISKAENLFQDRKKEAKENLKELAENTVEFGKFRKSISTIIVNIIKKSSSKDRNRSLIEELLKLSSLHKSNLNELEELYKNTNKIFQKNPSFEDVQIAEVKVELALLLNSFEPLATDLNSPSGKRSLSWKEKRERLTNSQDLLSQALQILKKLLQKNDDAVLITTLYLANSLSQSADFEKALPLYKEYIGGVEAKYGIESESLLPYLKMYAAILQMIGKNNEASEILQQIFAITGKKEDLTETLLLVTPRAKSVTYKGITGKKGVEAIYTPYYGRINPNGVLVLGTPTSANTVGSGSRNMVNVEIAKYVATKVFVLIDESGKVIEAHPQTEDEKLRSKVERDVLRWKFRPLEYNGVARKMKGYVYHYEKQ